MGVSTRIIRVLDGQYTLELEVEVEDGGDLLAELSTTPWGRKMAYLLSQMLPNVPEIKTEDQKVMLEAEEKRLAEHEESLMEKGRKEILNKYSNKTYDEIKKEATKVAEKAMRKKYMAYIRKEHLKTEAKPDTPADGCFGNHNFDDIKCQKCASRKECQKRQLEEVSDNIKAHTDKVVEEVVFQVTDGISRRGYI